MTPVRYLCLLLLLAPWSSLWGQAARPKLLHGPAAAKGKVVREVWQDRRNGDGRLGWVQTLSYEVEDGGQTLIRTVQRDHLRYLRSGDPYQEDAEEYTLETRDGRVVEFGYRTTLGKNQDLVIRGRPRGQDVVLEVLDQLGEKVIYRVNKAWNVEARGIYFQERLLDEKELQAGKRFEVKSFLTVMNAVAPTYYTVMGPKKMTVAGQEREVVQVEQSFPKEFHLDKSWHYFDPVTKEKLLTTEENSLFGLVTHERVEKESALATFAGKVKDREAPVTIDKPLTIGLLGLPRRLRLKIEMSEDDDPSTAFVSDMRQQLVKKDGRLAEVRLAVKRLDDLQAQAEPKPGPEFLESNYYVRSDDVAVRKLAVEAVGDAIEPRKKMERIIQFVRKNVKGEYGVGFTTADEVARTLEGDCTEMGILAAAMGRAAGVPTRIAFGLVYDVENPGFGGHLWIEAYVDGTWQTFDPTGVVPLLGAAYLKIQAFSFKDILNPDELTALRRAFAGKMKISVLESK
jgi:hypothetical protein